MNKTYDDFGDPCSEIRVLPLPGSANILCGKRGYYREIAFRKERNEKLADSCKYPLPDWDDLKVYFPAEE
jgi:hypothetical protein